MLFPSLLTGESTLRKFGDSKLPITTKLPNLETVHAIDGLPEGPEFPGREENRPKLPNLAGGALPVSRRFDKLSNRPGLSLSRG